MLQISHSCVALYNLQRFNAPPLICSSQQPWAVTETGTWGFTQYVNIGAGFPVKTSVLNSSASSLTGPHGSAEHHEVSTQWTPTLSNELRDIFTN